MDGEGSEGRRGLVKKRAGKKCTQYCIVSLWQSMQAYGDNRTMLVGCLEMMINKAEESVWS